MIQFRPATYSEIESCIPHELRTTSLSDAGYRYFGVFDGQTCIGFSRFKMEVTAVIDAIYIVEHERRQKFGDGLFRSTLNAIERGGVDRVICHGSESELSFYLHEGLNRTENQHVSLDSIGAFFDQPCKGKRPSV